MDRRTTRQCLAASLSLVILLPAWSIAQDRSNYALFLQVSRAVLHRGCAAISDRAGNAGSNPVDFTALYVANDAQNVYFLVEFAGNASANVSSFIHIDTDRNQMTGCDVFIPHLNGSELLISLLSPELGGAFVGNHTGCSAGSDDFPNRGGIRTATIGRYIAVSVPLSTFREVTPDIQGFLFWFDGGGNFGPAGHTLL